MDDRKEPSEFHKTETMKEVERLKAESEKKMKEGKKEEDIEVYDQPDIDNKDNVNDAIKTKKMIDKDIFDKIVNDKKQNINTNNENKLNNKTDINILTDGNIINDTNAKELEKKDKKELE